MKMEKENLKKTNRKSVFRRMIEKIVVILQIFMVLLPTTYALANSVDFGDELWISRGDLGFYTLQYWSEYRGRWMYITYSQTFYTDKNGEKNLAYCVNPDLDGVGYLPDESEGYNVKVEKRTGDRKIWKILRNGYPNVSKEELGVETDDDAYLATKQAIYWVIRGWRLDEVHKYFRGGEDEINGQNVEDIKRRGTKVVDAIYKLVDIAYNHKDINLVLNDNTLKFFGKSVHGATPWLGVNAGLHLLNFFGEEYGIEELCKLFIALEKGDGKSFGGDFTSETFDSTSYAIGKMNFKNNTIKLIINLRLPENVNISEPIEKLEKFTSSKCNDLGGCDALVIPLESTLVQTLCNVYKEETGDEINKPLAIGGGTYAKESKNSLAFGPTFPGRDFFIHQDDEYFFISDFENIIGIYAHAIDALGKALRENK